MNINFIDYYFLYLISLERERVRKEQGLILGGKNRMIHDIQVLCPGPHRFELGKNFRTSGKHIELILAIVPFGQINGRMLELEKLVIYDP